MKLPFAAYLHSISYNNSAHVDWCLYLNKKIILERIRPSKEGTPENINELIGSVFRIVEKRFEIWTLTSKTITKKTPNITFGFAISVADPEGSHLFKTKIVTPTGPDITTQYEVFKIYFS